MTGLERPRAARALRPGRRWAAGLTAALALLLAAAPAGAQTYFPVEDPTPQVDDDFSGLALDDWTAIDRPSGWGSAWALDSSPPAAVTSHWAQHVAELTAVSGQDTLLLATATTLGFSNGRLELELSADRRTTRLGAAWNVAVAGGDGYVLSFTNLPEPSQASPPQSWRALWRLEKYVGGTGQTIGQGTVELALTVDPTMVQEAVYGLRISSFCGNMRVELREVYEVAGVAQFTDWETLFQWTDPSSLGPGMVGLYASSTSPDEPADARFDNVKYGSWPETCELVCTNWSAWDESWVTGDETSRDRLGFKLLYEGVLHDYMNTNDIVDGTTWGRIDCGAGIDDTCDGYRMLVDMPDPDDIVTSADRQAQQQRIDGYLESISSAVRFEKSSAGAFSFVQDYNDPLRADYVDGDPDNPIPIVASGDTPIAASMMDAYDWYVGLRSGDGAWTQDSLDLCRNWYVVLITDGEEHCGGDVCGAGQAAALFAEPDVEGLPPVKVSTIGYSAGVAETSPLRCIASETGGEFYTATDAAELAESLDRLINNYLVEDRAFVPVSVAPPLTSVVAGQENDFLVTVPIFQPINGRSVWDGHMHAFKLNASTPYPPRDVDGSIDTSSDAWLWDAGEELGDQLRDASAFRNLYWPSNASGSWARVSLALAKSNATRKAEFRALTGDARVTDAVVDTIVDFLYFFDDADRPDDYDFLGDIWHSQPAIVGAPRNFQYLANNVSDYVTFANTYRHRRRVAFAGGNDGILHAFDLGQYNSATQAYTTGTGWELFGMVPREVMPQLFDLAALAGPREQQYMVDGPVVAADVRIDVGYSGDPGDSDPDDREWRTIVLATLRGGGHAMLALDVTRPDTVPDASVDLQPDCLSTGVGCPYEYPRVMWEFADPSDADLGFANGVCTDAVDCEDLGETWSKPVILRVQKATDDEMYVAFFGGGHDPEGDHTTGNFFYGVDVETGQVIYKANVGASVPGGVAGLDLDDDGFTDRIYFGTTSGFLYRLDVSAQANLATDGTEVPPGYRVTNWVLTPLYSFGASVQFYTTPVLVPALFESDGYKWAIAIGSGDRSTIDQESTVVERFYFVLDYPNSDGTTPLRGEANLQGIAYNAAVAPAGTSYFDPTNPTNPKYGWYLILREGEKVSADAIVANERVQFPTFVRTPFDPDNPPTVEDEDGNEIVVCQASGVGRLYDVIYENANPSDDSPFGDERGGDLGGGLIVGGTDYTVGDQTIALWTTMSGGQQEVVILGFKFHRVTNWRQE